MNSEDDFGAVGYLAPQSLEGHKSLGRQFSINDSGIVDFHGSFCNSHIGMAIPNCGYSDWDENSDPRTPTSTIAFFQRMNSHNLPATPPWGNQRPDFFQTPEKYTKVPDYEELPNSGRNPDDPDVYTPIDEGSVIVTNPKKSQNANHPLGKQAQINFETTGIHSRLRANPLYDQSGKSFARPSYPPPKRGLNAGGSCCLQTFGFLFALVALALVLWSVLAGRSGGSEYQELVKNIEALQSNLSNLNEMVQNIEERVESVFLSHIKDVNPIIQLLHNTSDMLETLSDLQGKVTSIRTQVSLQDASIKNVTKQIATQTDQITFLKSQEGNANETYENLRLSISKMKQLEMRGLANMSGCKHTRKSFGRASSNTISQTDPIDLAQFLVLGVLCTTAGGTEALLVDSPTTPDVYQCICRGIRDGATDRYCIIHYWTCPILPLSTTFQ